MTDRIDKQLCKLETKQQKVYLKLIERILTGDFQGLDIVKLKGNWDIYRVRKGEYRIIFQRMDSGEVKILAFEHRSETTYKSF